MPGADGLDLDHAYKAMAWLGEVDAAGRSTAEAIEEALYHHRQPLFGAVSIAFFDTTQFMVRGRRRREPRPVRPLQRLSRSPEAGRARHRA